MTAPRLAIKKKKGRKSYVGGAKVLRTPADAVAETGLVLSTLALFPEQVSI